MNPTFIIREVEPAELTVLEDISRKTFYETFIHYNSEENMQHYLNEHMNADKLKKEFAGNDSKFYFIVQNGTPVGYLKLNFRNAQTEPVGNDAMEIERIYVLKEYQGQSAGQHLFDHSMAVAKENHMKHIWLGVWEYNKKAMNFYAKNGFEEFGDHTFMLGNDGQRDLLMRREVQ